MNQSRKNSAKEGARPPAKKPGDLQPPPTGANGGSPAAPVMKEFQKTKAESSGRS